MKRYWKLIILSAVILFTFTVYYLQPIIAKEELFELELVTTQDTNNIEEDITIIGDVYESQYTTDNYYHSDYNPFQLTSEAMKYTSELNYFEQLNNLHADPKMEQLKKDYRNFMRGKDSIELLFEDEESLAYVGPYGQNPDNGIIQLNISILNKVSDEKDNFTVEVPLQGHMYFVNIMDVQLLNEKLYILTSHYGESGEDAYYLYQIDVAERELKHNQSLNDVIGNGYWTVNVYNTIGKETHYVFRKNEEEQGDGTENEMFVSYHIETGEINEVEVPNNWSRDNDTPESEINPFILGNYTIKNEYMYFIHFTEEEMLIDQYNLLENTLEAKEELPLDAEMIEGINLVYADGGKVSFISTTSRQGTKDRSIFIIDLIDTEVIYQGEINISNIADELQVYDIDFYQVHLN